MKFTCSQAAILKAVNTVIKAVSVRTTIPILKCILINVKDGRATFTSSNLNMSIETSFDVTNYENGNAVVSAKLFSDIVRKLPNSLINISMSSNNKLSINCLGSDFDIISLPPEEFPIIGELTSKDYFEFNKKDFKDIISKVVFSASLDEKKGIFTGCLFNIENNKMEAVALDGFRVAIVNKNISENKQKRVIIPASILSEIYKILNEDDGSDEISVLFEEKKAEFLTEDTKVISRLLEGEFINYKSAVPSSYNTKFTVNRVDLQNSLERTALFCREGKSNLVKINVKQNEIELESNSEEGNVKEVIGADVEGENLVIGFNSKFISDILKSVNDEEVVFEMGTSLSACAVKPAEGNEYTYIILPVRSVID